MQGALDRPARRIVAQAIRIATTAPRGPVLLDIPADVLDAEMAVLGCADSRRSLLRLRLLRQSMRASNGWPARHGRSCCSAARRRRRRGRRSTICSRSTGVPCFADYGAIGSVSDDDARYGGTLYQLGRLPEGSRPDVVLAVGVRFGFDTPGLRDGGVAWGTTILQVDSDPAEVGRFAPAEISVIADPGEMIAALASRSRAHVWKVDPDWVRARFAPRCAATRAELDAIDSTDGARLHPYAAARIAADVAARHDAVIVGDGAVCKHWLHDALRLPGGARYVTHSRLGCMGQGHGAAMGAAKATPGRPVVCITGDGAVGFAIGEFEAMVRHRPPDHRRRDEQRAMGSVAGLPDARPRVVSASSAPRSPTPTTTR